MKDASFGRETVTSIEDAGGLLRRLFVSIKTKGASKMIDAMRENPLPASPPAMERKRARQRAYYLRHRDERKEKARAYYWNHREEIRARLRASREALKEKRREYYQKNRARLLAYQKAYREAHRKEAYFVSGIMAPGSK